jgi:hypothetical protein
VISRGFSIWLGHGVSISLLGHGLTTTTILFPGIESGRFLRRRANQSGTWEADRPRGQRSDDRYSPWIGFPLQRAILSTGAKRIQRSISIGGRIFIRMNGSAITTRSHAVRFSGESCAKSRRRFQGLDSASFACRSKSFPCFRSIHHPIPTRRSKFRQIFSVPSLEVLPPTPPDQNYPSG